MNTLWKNKEIKSENILELYHTYFLHINSWTHHIFSPPVSLKLNAKLVHIDPIQIGKYHGTLYEFECCALEHDSNTHGNIYNAMAKMPLKEGYQYGPSKFGYRYGTERLVFFNGQFQTWHTFFDCSLFPRSIGSVSDVVFAKRKEWIQHLL